PDGMAANNDWLEEAAAALRAFALIDREVIADERDPAIKTDCIRLHPLVVQVAAERCVGEAREAARRSLMEAMEAAYPMDVFANPTTWPRARRLDALALALVGPDNSWRRRANDATASVLIGIAAYRLAALAAHREARALFERALSICEEDRGSD